MIHNRSEIDGIEDSGPVNDHFSSNVSVVVSLVVQHGERRKPRCDLWEEDHSFPVRSPDLLFSTTLERDETVDNFGKIRQYRQFSSIVILNAAS